MLYLSAAWSQGYHLEPGRVVYAGGQASGRLHLVWDCRDERGERVLPGVYLYRLWVQAEENPEQQVGTVRVVY